MGDTRSSPQDADRGTIYMKSARTLALLALLMPLSALAQTALHDGQGNALPDTSSAKSSEGFSASMVVTADPEWQQKWENPVNGVPRFELATEVKEGGSLYILSFLTNPKLDAAGMAQVRCDLRITRPDGSLSGDEHDLPCFVTQLDTDPNSVYLSSVGMKFTAEAGDPHGTWTVAITVRDTVRNVSLPLQSSFDIH
jgi:hypothetical protein